MNEILSNQEIDTLLEMFRSEEGALDAVQDPALKGIKTPREREVHPVDLLKPYRLGRDHLRVLGRYFESVAKSLSATISDKLRLETRCDCVAVEQARFQSWLEQLPGPAAFYTLRMEPLSQPVLFTATTSLLYGAVDRILGGSGKVSKVPKDFTAAEYTVADALVGPCLDRICEGLAEMLELRWQIEGRFCNPSAAQILPSQDVVLSVYFQVAGDFLMGDLRLVIPFVALEQYLDGLGKNTVTGMEPGALREQVVRTVRGVPLDFRVELGSARIRLHQLLGLEVGDVVPLEARVGEPAVAPVQGKPKFKGQVGRLGNRLAFRVVDVVEA